MDMKNTICIFLFILLLSGCDQDFEEINTNPNAPIAVQPEFLLRKVIYDFGEQMSYEGFVAGNLLGQYMTAIDFNLFDRHSLTEPQLGGNPWPIIYTNLRDNDIILQRSRESEIFSVYEGPALILKAYMTAALTDIYGNVPYTEALSGLEGNSTPRYDEQEQIYRGIGGILDNLDNALIALASYNGTQSLSGDILFDGDLQAWIRFANALKIKALMRISNRVDVSAQLSQIFTNEAWITNNSQNATFDFSNTQPNTFRMAILRAGDFNLFVMSATMQEILDQYNDPRRDVFFRPFGSTDAYRGLLNGPDASQTSISVADYSLAGTIFRENTAALDANFITAWEVHFLLAEAAERGLINGDAQALYETGVQLAFDYWNTTMPADYLSVGAAAFDNNDHLPLIITQKWIANMINGYEGWIEYRRTGFPELKPISASLNNDLIPVRMPYPTEEATLNTTNFNNATSANNNSVNSPVWWDQN